jgi:carbon-monoxide dehydrogenase iron sulfur subunit
MKRVYVNEKWCLGCHLCEFSCAFANSGNSFRASVTAALTKALKGKTIYPRIQVEGDNDISFAVSCRHCETPYCLKACITGALHSSDGVITCNTEKCIGCHTCILSCPYGCIMPAEDHSVIQKCELCIGNGAKIPVCVEGCPNNAIVFEDRGKPAFREANATGGKA